MKNLLSRPRATTIATITGLAIFSLAPSTAIAHEAYCEALDRTFEVRTNQGNYYEHEVRVRVNESCVVTGSWRHTLGSGSGQSSIDGHVVGDTIRFDRTALTVHQLGAV